MSFYALNFAAESVHDRGWLPQCLIIKFTNMASKKEIERLEKRIELLEMEFKQLKTVEPKAINERFKLIEETLYSTKDILNMKEVGQYLDISQSLLYKLTCNGEIPHFKPRGKMIFFEKKVLVEWIKQNPSYVSKETSDSHSIELNTADNNEEDLKEEQH